MSLLESIHRGRSLKPRRTLLYGVQGVGKSTFGAKAPDSVFIQTEDGLGEIDCDSLPLSQSHQDVMKALEALYVEKHSYQTVVLDSLDWLEQLVWAEVCQQRSVESIEEIGYGKGYVFAMPLWRNLLSGFDALRNDKAMSVILIAHSKIERFENPATDSYDRYVPRLHKLASQLMQEWCDEVLFANYKVYTKPTEEGFNRKRAKGIGSGERVLYTTERPSHVAKNRLNLPDELPLEWEAYAQHFTQPNQ